MNKKAVSGQQLGISKSRDIYGVYIRWCGIRDYPEVISTLPQCASHGSTQGLTGSKRGVQKKDPLIEASPIVGFAEQEAAGAVVNDGPAFHEDLLVAEQAERTHQ